MKEITTEQQQSLSEMLFFFHFDQMAAHAQVLRSRIMRQEGKQSFNRMLKTINYHIKHFEHFIGDGETAQTFQEHASMMGDMLQLFLISDDPAGMLKRMIEVEKELHENACAAAEDFICPTCGSSKTYKTEAYHCSRCAETVEV